MHKKIENKNEIHTRCHAKMLGLDTILDLISVIRGDELQVHPEWMIWP